MRILNKLRKPYFSIILSSIILLSSCSNGNEHNNIENRFSYETFEAYKNYNLLIEIPSKILNISDKKEKYQGILDVINKEFESDLIFTEIDESLINNLQQKSNNSNNINSFLNSTDIDLLEKFNLDISSYGLQTAIENFEKNVMDLKIDNLEFNRYNSFVNVIKLIDNEDSSIFNKNTNNKNISAKTQSACGEAIAAYSLATIGLASCVVSGPFMPIVCGAAIAGKVLAYRAMMRDCQN